MGDMLNYFLYSFGRRGGYIREDVMFYICFIIPIMIFSIIVQIKLKYTYSKFSKIRNKKGVVGAVVARNILDSYGLQHVRVEPVGGSLTDHYDPRDNVVRLSRNNYEGSSIAAIGVAAHEVGHAVQHATGYLGIKVRSAVIPVTRFGSFLSMPIILLGLIFGNPKLAFLGVILFSLIVFFELATLFVEFDASSRAVRVIVSQNILEIDEVFGVRKVLWAAAMTYVASFLSALLQLIRLILIVTSSNKRDD